MKALLVGCSIDGGEAGNGAVKSCINFVEGGSISVTGCGGGFHYRFNIFICSCFF